MKRGKWWVPARPAGRPQGAWQCAVRLFWAVMLVGHAPAFVSALARLAETGPTGASLFKVLFLGGSSLYFLFKLAGFAYIQVHPSWSRIVVYSLIVGLLHTAVVVEKVGGAGPLLNHWVVPIVLATAGISLIPVARNLIAGEAHFSASVVPARTLSHPAFAAIPSLSAREALVPKRFRRGPPAPLP